MGTQRARRAADEGAASKPELRPEQTPRSAPTIPSDGPRSFLKAQADKLLDWYAALPRSLRIGLFGSLAAFGFMGVVAAASNALVPLPSNSNWANIPGGPATSLSVRVTGATGAASSSTTPSASAPTTAQLPSATEATSSPGAPSATATASGTHKATATASQKTTSATQTQASAPAPTTDPTTAAPNPTTAAPTTIPPTDPPTSDPPTTDPTTTEPDPSPTP